MADFERLAGVFTKDSSGTAGATNTITAGFQPKAVILWTINANANATDITNRDLLFSYGFSDGTNGFSIGGGSADNVGDTVCSRRIASKAISIPLPDASAIECDGTVTFTSTEVVVTWDTNNTKAMRVGYLILGGDLLSAKAVSWSSPATTGSMAVTGVGFAPKAIVNIMSRSQSLDGLATSLQHGMGVVDSAGNQSFCAFRSQHGQIAANTNRYQSLDHCIGHVTGSVQASATWTSMDSDGFTYNFDVNVPLLAMKGASLCLGGPIMAKVGNWDKGSAAGTNNITSVGFRAKALLFMSNSRPSSASVNNDNDNSLGAYDGTNNYGSQSSDLDDSAVGGADPTLISLHSNNSNAVVIRTHSGSLGQVTGFTSNGFDVTWSPDSSSNDNIIYLALTAMSASMATATATASAKVLVANTQLLLDKATATASAGVITTSSSGGSSAGLSPATATASANALTVSNQKLLSVATATAAAQAIVTSSVGLMARATATAAALAITVLGLVGIPNLWLKRRLENSFARTSVRSPRKTDLKIHG